MRPSIFIIAIIFTGSRLVAQDLVSNEIEKGYWKDGRKFSIWEYYTANKELEFKIDHTTGRVYYLRPDTSRFAILRDSAWRMEPLRIYPIPIDGYQNLYKNVRDKLLYPQKARLNAIEVQIYVMFDVDEAGHVTDIVQLGEVGYGFEEEISAAINAMQQTWVAARVEGKPVRSRFILPFQYSLNTQKVFAPVELPIARLLTPVRVVAKSAAEISNSQSYALSRNKLPLVLGTIFKKSGDSLKCLIEVGPDFDTQVNYKRTLTDKEVSIAISEIKSIRFEDAKFENMLVEGEEDLLQVLVEGKVNLYKHVRETVPGMYGMSYVFTRQTTRYTITSNNFDSILPELVRDNFKIYDRLQLKPYKFTDVPDIVYEYTTGIARGKTERPRRPTGMGAQDYDLIEGDTVWNVVDVPPEYIGGYEGMMNFIRKNMRYPASARRMGIDGTVITSFIVEPDGSLNHLTVVRGISADCDQEAVRVVSAMSKWKPGIRNGKAVRTRFNLPLKYKLN
jgi:TonB family protein